MTRLMENDCKMREKISVIIPAYNAEKYIAEALDSVLAQTYPIHEIIVIDDGSTDKTAEVVHRYINSRTRELANPLNLKYFYQENRGPAAARNSGIREATGEYIAFLDADDTWMPEKLARQIEKFNESPDAGLVHAKRIRIDESGAEQETRKRHIPEGFIFDSLLRDNFICCSSTLVKKQCFDDVGLFDEHREIAKSEDYDMWLRIARQYQIGYVDLPLIKYRVNPSGYCRSDLRASYAAQKAVFLRALDCYKGNKTRLRKEVLHKMMYDMGHSFLYIKDYTSSSLAFLEAIKFNRADFKSLGFYLLAKTRKASGR